ncbi:sigma-70 family RNA polymerase sigma factor [bacterium]|nr:sigma-70 family RNA polymerase sigma factor [bacterium]
MDYPSKAFWNDVLGSSWQRRYPAIVVNRVYARYQRTLPFQEAEDIFGATLERVLVKETLPGLEKKDPEEVRKIIFGYLFNVIREWWRGELRHPSGDDVDSMTYVPNELTVTQDIKERVFNDAWRAFDDEERLVFQMCYLDGLTQFEVASRMNWAIGRVNARLQSARRKFYDILARVSEGNYASPQSWH